jgi:hypothetical protein
MIYTYFLEFDYWSMRWDEVGMQYTLLTAQGKLEPTVVPTMLQWLHEHAQ